MLHPIQNVIFRNLSRSKFLLHITHNKIFACSDQDFLLHLTWIHNSLGHIPHEIYGMEWSIINYFQQTVASNFNQMCLPLFSTQPSRQPACKLGSYLSNLKLSLTWSLEDRCVFKTAFWKNTLTKTTPTITENTFLANF